LLCDGPPPRTRKGKIYLDDDGRELHPTITVANLEKLILCNYQMACNLSTGEIKAKINAIYLSTGHPHGSPLPLPLFLSCVRKNPTLFAPSDRDDEEAVAAMANTPGRLRNLDES